MREAFIRKYGSLELAKMGMKKAPKRKTLAN
jgi:hypothetical protein